MKSITIKNINNEELKVKVFTKADLREKLGFNDEEVKLIMKYQKIFPDLLQEIDGFVINARTLWENLGKPYSEFKKWYDKKVLSYGYAENRDFINIEQKVDIKNTNISRTQREFYLTVDCAKNVAMAERTDKGRLVRDYFIMIEKALRKMDNWVLIREPEKEGYKELCKYLDAKYQETHPNNKTPFYVYSNEANMINISLLGKNAKQIIAFLGTKDTETREHLNAETNKVLYELQILDSSLIITKLDFEKRKSIIETTCKVKYSKLVLEIKDEIKRAA